MQFIRIGYKREGKETYLVIKGTQGCAGKKVSITNIFEVDGLDSNTIDEDDTQELLTKLEEDNGIVPPVELTFNSDGEAKLIIFRIPRVEDSGLWTDEDPEYKFKAEYSEGDAKQTKESGELKVETVQEWEECIGINYCSEMGDEETCRNCGDINSEIAIASIQANFPGVTCEEERILCECFWNGTACGVRWLIDAGDNAPGDLKNIGYCQGYQDTSDDCSDGFLTYTLKGTWTWNESNCFSESDISSNPKDYIEDEHAGCYRYDPLRWSEKCKGGEKTVACSARAQLPFFSIYNLIGVIVLVILFYVLITLRNKRLKKRSKNKKEEKSPTRKSSKRKR